MRTTGRHAHVNIRRTMTTPIVTEITRRLEPVVHDTFGDPRPVLRPSWPAPKRRRYDA